MASNIVKNVAVVGAGPAGLSAAYQLAKAGVSVDVYEAGDSVGGMAKTITLWGQRVDLGPHRFFSSDPRVNRLWLELAGRDYSMVSRLTRIYYKNTFFHYPLKPLNALFGLGVIESVRCLMSYVFARFSLRREARTFQDWVESRFGARLFEIFFRSYSEKLWGISCRNLDADFAAQRIKKFSLLEALIATFRRSGNTKHKTLVDEFAYPHDGAGMVYERMAETILRLGGAIFLRSPVSAVYAGTSQDRARVKLANGDTTEYDHVISTMPISLLVKQMNAPADVAAHAQALTFRNTILVYLLVEGENPFPDQWIYVHSPMLRTGRITNFSNWSPSPKDRRQCAILCLEYWCNDSESLWSMTEVDLIALATREIYETTLVKPGRIKDGHVVRIPKCYPVYATGYKTHLSVIQTFLTKQVGISVIGRYGAFKYNNQDHSILMGILAAENILGEARHNLWELNTDYEYQESSKITATGLVIAD